MKQSIDPITLEVIKNALSSTADEMALIIMRSAYSSIVRDSMDYSTVLCDRQGHTVAQGLTNPNHLGSFPDAMSNLIKTFKTDMRPDDIFIFNDPYGSGGMHLPDIYIVKPIFLDGAIQGYAANLAHHTDVGGIAPGSNAVYATEVYQEGLRLPLLKLEEAGKPNQTVFRIIEVNTRLPIKVLGDLRAQVAASRSAEKAYLQLLAKYGTETFHRYVEELHNYAERRMRAEIAQLPDGVYTFTDWIDGFGDNRDPIVFKVTVTIAGDEITIDWTGTSPMVKAALNCPMPFTNSIAYLAVRCIVAPDIPNCQGFMRPIKVIAPLGSIVNSVLPAACAARGLTGFRMMDALFGAFAKVVPNRVPAAGEGGVSFPAIGGWHNSKPFVVTETLVGTWGGRYNRDGYEGVANICVNVTNQPIELIETEYPVEITRYGMVRNSGGPGRQRGGLGLVREYKLLAEEAVLTMRSDRRLHRPYGLFGGCAGTPSLNIINPGSEQRILPVMPMEAVPLKQGDVFCHIAAGGGGYGNPLERPPERVCEDVRDERITTTYARDVYGVVLDPTTRAIDFTATERCRRVLAQKPHQALQDAAHEHFLREVGIDPDPPLRDGSLSP